MKFMGGGEIYMKKYRLIKPDISYKSDIEDYRKEMLNAKSSMDGTGPFQRMENIGDWLEFNKKCEHKESAPENWVTCEQYIYVRELDNKILGMIQFRHYFNEFLEKYGGHIGYTYKEEKKLLL